MFSFVRSIMGTAVAQAAADSEFITAVCENKHAGPVVRAFASVGEVVPPKRADALKWLRAVVADPIAPGRSDAIRVGFPLFATACLAALEKGDPELLQRFESDMQAGIAALKTARETAKANRPAKASKPAPAPTTGTAPAPTTGTAPAPTTGTAPAPADIIGDALRVIGEASDAGLLTAAHWMAIDAILCNKPAPAVAPAVAPAQEPATV